MYLVWGTPTSSTATPSWTGESDRWCWPSRSGPGTARSTTPATTLSPPTPSPWWPCSTSRPVWVPQCSPVCRRPTPPCFLQRADQRVWPSPARTVISQPTPSPWLSSTSSSSSSSSSTPLSTLKVTSDGFYIHFGKTFFQFKRPYQRKIIELHWVIFFWGEIVNVL